MLLIKIKLLCSINFADAKVHKKAFNKINVLIFLI